MTTSLRWTSADLEALPDDGKRYEIIDGELHVSRQPHGTTNTSPDGSSQCFRLAATGPATRILPGVIFADDDDAAPDVVWISNSRLATALGADGKLRAAPELAS